MTALEQFRFPQQPQLSTPEPLKWLDLEISEVFEGFLTPSSSVESKAQREEKRYTKFLSLIQRAVTQALEQPHMLKGFRLTLPPIILSRPNDNELERKLKEEGVIVDQITGEDYAVFERSESGKSYCFPIPHSVDAKVFNLLILQEKLQRADKIVSV
jgi:hypothetical protein